MKRWALGALLGAVLAAGGAAGEAAAAAHARPRPVRCHAGYAGRLVRVRERRYGRLVRRHGRVVWVRVSRCVKKPKPPVKTATPTAPASPSVRYTARVDPSFTQAKSNPLAVTYSYSADATQTVGTVSTDLASAGQLPAGVLNFYSEQSPGGPQSLYCSINVGGSAVGSSCPITYAQTGTYQVTTQYIPNAAAATTQTDTETISPFTTQTTLSVTSVACPTPPSTDEQEACYELGGSAVDQNGTTLTGTLQFPMAGAGAGDRILGGAADIPIGQKCLVEATFQPPSGSAEGQTLVTSPDCNTATADVFAKALGPTAASWAVAASYPGTDGWSASASPAQTLAP